MENSLFLCKICNKNFENEKNLNIHIKTHSNNNNNKKFIQEITEDLLFQNNKSKKYSDLKEINLQNKNLIWFVHNKKINFNNLTPVIKINLSNNYIKNISDLKFLINLKEINISNNKIISLSFCEFLLNLENLNAENNQITAILNLEKNKKIKILKLSHNNIENYNMTLDIINKLKNIEELTINFNPFLNEIFAYKKFFTFIFQYIIKLDNEIIQDVDRDLARRFIFENKEKYYKINLFQNYNPNSNVINNIENNNYKTQNNFGEINNQYRVGNTILSKIGYVSYNEQHKMKNTAGFQNKNSDFKLNPIQNNKKLPNINKSNREYSELLKENKYLREIIEKQKNEIDDLKLELENIKKINEANEGLIAQYKMEKNIQSNSNNKIINSNYQNELIKLKEQCDIWKKEYMDLLEKTMNSNNLNKFQIENPLNISMSNFKFKKEFKFDKRPQTAGIRGIKSTDFDQLATQYKIINRKNSLDDSLSEEESNNEEDEEESENSKEEKIKKGIEKINEKINLIQSNYLNNKKDDDDEKIVVEDMDFGNLDEMLKQSFDDLKIAKEKLEKEEKESEIKKNTKREIKKKKIILDNFEIKK